MKDVGPTWEKCRLVGPGIATGREENIKEKLINKLTFLHLILGIIYVHKTVQNLDLY